MLVHLDRVQTCDELTRECGGGGEESKLRVLNNDRKRRK